MKSANIIRLCALAILSGAALNASLGNDSEAPQTVKTTDGRELKLVWNDEFNGEGLPDARKWNYEVGYIRNNESQYYTNARQENIFQKDGVLTIRTLKEKYPLEGKPNNQGRDHAEYTSACIETRGLASWTYGRIETRAKLPKGKGIWPAIWMLGDSISQIGWPKCGEIDIMEYVGHTPNTVHSTVHMHRPGGENWHNVSQGSKLTLNKSGEEPEERFYVYTVEWTPEKLIFLVDDKVVLEADAQKLKEMTDVYPFNAPHYLILNTAIGGAWGGEIDNKTCPAEFIIDYVRVYQ
ncbi:MAG: glycoside hydrolase family 16 protein [Planctomycetia bacterium]|nr:glycoside hydrolase family 16 protein [Planctomycetia bacterium]